MRFINNILFAFIILGLCFTTQSFAQKEKSKKRNSPYSTNPPVKKAKKKKEVKAQPTNNKVVNEKKKTPTKETNEASKQNTDLSDNTGNKGASESQGSDKAKIENLSLANVTRKIARNASKESRSPQEYYKVGVGDVLYINLQDTSAKYFTVLVDGTIDYPLAGKFVSVIDLTTDEIEDLLGEKIKLYENPSVTVKVREYVSHKIKVSGLARTGDHFLQREAMPLIVVKTMVGVKDKATKVKIERDKTDTKTFDLSDTEASNFLIYSGDRLTFSNENSENQSNTSANTFYYLGEKICKGGKKKFHSGITLIQAVFEACGGFNKKLKQVSITRKTKSGKYLSRIYKIKDIVNGKEADPKLRSDDLIEVEK